MSIAIKDRLGPPIQSAIHKVQGNPEGLIDAPLGTIAVDVVNAALYIKTTDEGTLTGWQNLSVQTTFSMTADNAVKVAVTAKYDSFTDSYTFNIQPA